MKKFITLLILATAPLAAFCLEGRADVLYWKVSNGGEDLGIERDHVRIARPSHHVGFSAEARYWHRCYFGGAQYSYVKDFSVLDVRAGYQFFDHCQFSGNIFAGVEAVWDPFTAVGPELGIEGDFFLSSGWGLVGRLATSLLNGKGKTFPAVQARLAIAYRCRCVTGELGYGIRHYANPLVRRINGNTGTFTEQADFTIAGPFAAITVRF